MTQLLDRGDSETWATLSREEARCLVGMKSYYMIFESKSEEDAFQAAWMDLKREHERLEPFTWYKIPTGD